MRLRLLLMLLALAVLPVFGCARPPMQTMVRGELSGEQVWQGEILIAGDVTVAAGATLTILPGSSVRFLPADAAPGNRSEHPYFPGSELNIAGTLVAVGTPAAPIVFAAVDEAAPPGSWGAVNFAEGSRGTVRYCIFRQADSAIHSREATVEVTRSLFERNLVGIRFHTSDIKITSNLLRDNDTALRFHFGAPVVSLNHLERNRVNLFVTSHPSNYRFEHNCFAAPLEYHVVLGEEVPEAVQLGNNAWEPGDVAGVLERVFDGRRSPGVGMVVVEPLIELSAETFGPIWIR